MDGDEKQVIYFTRLKVKIELLVFVTMIEKYIGIREEYDAHCYMY